MKCSGTCCKKALIEEGFGATRLGPEFDAKRAEDHDPMGCCFINCSRRVEPSAGGMRTSGVTTVSVSVAADSAALDAR